MFFPLSTIKKFQAEIVFVAWLRDLSWKVKIVYLFLQENNSRKFLNLLLFYLSVFWPQISSAFAIIFADCHGLSCVHVQARTKVCRCVRTCNVRKMSRITIGAPVPGDFFPLASIVKRQLIYYLYISKLIYSTFKTPWWSLLLSDETRGR